MACPRKGEERGLRAAVAVAAGLVAPDATPQRGGAAEEEKKEEESEDDGGSVGGDLFGGDDDGY